MGVDGGRTRESISLKVLQFRVSDGAPDISCLLCLNRMSDVITK